MIAISYVMKLYHDKSMNRNFSNVVDTKNKYYDHSKFLEMNANL